MPIASGGTPGPRLAEDLVASDNNIYGLMHNAPPLEQLAQGLTNLGWRARSSAWDEYEVECTWCRVQLFDSGGMAKFAGVIEPSRIGELAGILRSLNIDYEIELYDRADKLVQTLRP